MLFKGTPTRCAVCLPLTPALGLKGHEPPSNDMKSIYAALISGLFLLPLAAYLFVFHGGISDSHSRWGEFGSYLSGIYGSLALFVVAYTTYLTREQFRRQNEDLVFFRLFDSLQNRVEASSIEVDGTTFSGHQCLKQIVERFSRELSNEAVELARLLLTKNPESIDNTQYMKLFDAMRGRRAFEDFSAQKSEFIEAIQSSGGFNDRWEKLKFYIGSRGEEPNEVREALCSMGSVNFYKIPFKDRQRHYAAALHRIVEDHGELLDGYLSTMLLVTALASEAANRLIYEKYIQSQLTRYEVVIIFYVLIGQETPVEGCQTVRDVGATRRLRTVDCQSLMIDMPSTEQIDVELGHLFAR